MTIQTTEGELAIRWRERLDENERPCYLSGFVDRVQGRYLVHHTGQQWTLSFDRIGSSRPEPLADGPLERVRNIALTHAAA